MKNVAETMRDANTNLAMISIWIDHANRHRDVEARTWGRLAKIGEEFGEVIAAYILMTGQNPRKERTGSVEDVKKELLDVALTALAAHEHLCNNTADTMARLAEHIASVMRRAQLEDQEQWR